jgi:arsenite methyltransferase
MAGLTTRAQMTTNSCCAPEAQATCCEPSAKAECCDPNHDEEGCGCAADTTTTQAGDICEQLRERYAAAAQVTIASVGLTDSPGPPAGGLGDHPRP